MKLTSQFFKYSFKIQRKLPYQHYKIYMFACIDVYNDLTKLALLAYFARIKSIESNDSKQHFIEKNFSFYNKVSIFLVILPVSKVHFSLLF